MIRWHASVRLFLLLAFLASAAPAQFKDQGLGFGALFGGTFGQTNLPDRKVDFMVRGFARYGILDPLQGEFGVGAGYVQGIDYRTLVFPIDYRFSLSLFPSSSINPYLYAGAGVLHFDVEEIPGNVSQGVDTKEWAVFIPAGAGIQVQTSENTALELQGGYHHTFQENLNAVTGTPVDAYWTFSLGLAVIGESGSADPDFDGLTNREEEELGTDKRKTDTDGDGLSDGDEIRTHHTSPLNPDSDGDGLNDSREVQTSRTNPLVPDTDGDGLEDGREVDSTKTDPLLPDTDADGLSDTHEVSTSKTDPLKADTDGDSLTDGDEVNRTQTDPLKADTDGGTVPDDVEVGRGTDPLNPADDRKVELKVEVGTPIILNGVTFETGKAEITASSDSVLQLAYNTLFQNPDITVEIRGYTDNTGRKATNMTLSQSRADAVKAWLVAKGIAGERITTAGFGPENPIASNATRDGRAQNRRIEFVRTR